LIRLLEEIIIEYILHQLGLTRASVLIQSGGKFFILADKGAKDKLKEIQNKIYKALIEKFK
jgi:CRISPR/Cas system-associated protein Cas10 (large subunit of type III CRISPR-Cas system)